MGGEELLGGGVRLEDAFALSRRLAGSLTVVGDPQGDPGAVREGLHGLGETEVLLALQEGDDVTALSAPEAVEEATRRGDGETRGLLVVERAQPLP